ncbi:MAG: ABC transporter permease [Stackebrandtia sp.]
MSDLKTALTPPDREAEAIATRERSLPRIVAARFFRHRLAVTSLIVFALIAAFAFIGPLLWKYDHQIDLINIQPNEEPSLEHPLGTTSAGHDVFAQLMRGTQQSLKVAFTVALLATVIGAVSGAVAGFYRGWIDSVIMRTVDVIFVVPFLAITAALSATVKGGVTWLHMALILGLLGWLATARVVRAEVLSLREKEFIESARASGAGDGRIIFRHLLPNTAGVIIVAATLQIATAILAEAALSYLGLGIQSPDTSLGLMIEKASSAAATRPWLFYAPGTMIVLICLVVNFIGDGLRDALDPRQTLVRK